ncbi:hypothetical protein HY732_02325 [Candidatus Uhrbacteria bacterium]|nr:hypothetical protein [Candidatus Uhrbacteria bacterium]
MKILSDRDSLRVGTWKMRSMDDPNIAYKYQKIKMIFDGLVADEVYRGKFQDLKQIEDFISKSRDIFQRQYGNVHEMDWIDHEILDEVVGEFMAGQRPHEERMVLGDLASVGELFGREYAEQNKKCEMTEAILADVYEKCKKLLSHKVRPDLMGILDDIYLGTLAKLRLRLVRLHGDFFKLEDRAESIVGNENQEESIDQKAARTRKSISEIIDIGVPKKTPEQRADQIHDNIFQTEIAFAGCRNLVADIRMRLDGEEFGRMTPSTREHLEELYMALDKKAAFTRYYRNKARERLEQNDSASANQLAGTFKEMTRSLQDDARQLIAIVNRYSGGGAKQERKQSLHDELKEKADALFLNARWQAIELFDNIAQKQNELHALKAIINPDDERRRTAYLIDILKGENGDHGIIEEARMRILDSERKVASLYEERSVNFLQGEHSPDSAMQKTFATDYTNAVRVYYDAVKTYADNVSRLNDAYDSLFPE